jgi:hypothetical protein
MLVSFGARQVNPGMRTFGQRGSLTAAANLVVAGAGLILTTALLRLPAPRNEA